jgi:putative DNA primase/helicase
VNAASDLAHRLNATRTGAGWTARCPAHHDRTASLSIGEGQDGKLLVHCHAGCSFDAILKAAGVEPAKPNGHDQKAGKRRLGKIVANYDYHDATGTMVFQVVRSEPKDFRQRRRPRPDDPPDKIKSGPDGQWVWSVKDAEKVPYRLSGLLNAAEVYICEGEKDCKLGLTATTNPGGADKDGEAGKKWPESFGQWFHGRRAILIPDNDESGHRHVQAVARKLSGRAASIRILELPGLPPKGDVSDWLAAGGTREQLEDMTVAALLWEPGDAPPEPEHEQADPAAWIEPIDVIGAPELVGWPELTPECLPAPLYSFVKGEADRLNTDPCALSGHVLAAVAAACSDAWRVKPKRHDRWTQQPRLWVCVIKDVGQRGTDMMRTAFWPIARIEDELRRQWNQDMAEWLEKNKDKKPKDLDPKPALPRLTTQDATIGVARSMRAVGAAISRAHRRLHLCRLGMIAPVQQESSKWP